MVKTFEEAEPLLHDGTGVGIDLTELPLGERAKVLKRIFGYFKSEGPRIGIRSLIPVCPHTLEEGFPIDADDFAAHQNCDCPRVFVVRGMPPVL